MSVHRGKIIPVHHAPGPGIFHCEGQRKVAFLCDHVHRRRCVLCSSRVVQQQVRTDADTKNGVSNLNVRNIRCEWWVEIASRYRPGYTSPGTCRLGAGWMLPTLVDSTFGVMVHSGGTSNILGALSWSMVRRSLSLNMSRPGVYPVQKITVSMPRSSV